MKNHLFKLKMDYTTFLVKHIIFHQIKVAEYTLEINYQEQKKIIKYFLKRQKVKVKQTCPVVKSCQIVLVLYLPLVE